MTHLAVDLPCVLGKVFIGDARVSVGRSLGRMNFRRKRVLLNRLTGNMTTIAEGTFALCDHTVVKFVSYEQGVTGREDVHTPANILVAEGEMMYFNFHMAYATYDTLNTAFDYGCDGKVKIYHVNAMTPARPAVLNAGLIQQFGKKETWGLPATSSNDAFSL